MCNNEQLVGYLYEDLSAPDRAEFERHLASCPECRRELQGLRQTRQTLAAWTPAVPEFDFQIVQSPRVAVMPQRRFGMIPQWALAAAASLLVMAGAAAIANVEVRYDANGLVVRTGWASEGVQAVASDSADRSASPAAPAVVRDGSSEELRAQVAELAQRLQDVEQSQAAGVARVSAPRPGISAAELRKILAESESRQRTEMAVQMAQMWNDFNATRASDFARVQQTFAPELQRQQRLIENVMFRTTGTQR